MKRKLTLFLLLFAFLVTSSVNINAAELKRPKLDILSSYMNNAVYLKWQKVRGAKQYEIWRAKVNPKKALKTGKWQKWAVTKKNVIKKKSVGDYKYKVRAVNGNKKSAWSPAKRIFGARGRITNVIYDKPSYIWGMYIEGQLTFRVLINNKTQSQMGFVKTGSQSTIYAIDKNTGKIAKSWPGYLYIAESTGYAKQINPGKKNSVYFYCRMNEEEYSTFQNHKFMVTASFYPNPWVEPISTQMAIACTSNIKESAIAGK